MNEIALDLFALSLGEKGAWLVLDLGFLYCSWHRWHKCIWMSKIASIFVFACRAIFAKLFRMEASGATTTITTAWSRWVVLEPSIIHRSRACSRGRSATAATTSPMLRVIHVAIISLFAAGRCIKVRTQG